MNRKHWSLLLALGLGTGGVADADVPAGQSPDGDSAEVGDALGAPRSRAALTARLAGDFIEVFNECPSLISQVAPPGRTDDLQALRLAIGALDVHEVLSFGDDLVVMIAKSGFDGSWHQVTIEHATTDHRPSLVRIDPMTV